MRNNFYITAPIFYPNADLHMGHAFTTVLCDVLARYHRLAGDEVFFLVGSDENASKVVQVAEAKGITPKEFADQQAEKFKDFYRTLNLTNNIFIQTSDQTKHWPGALKMWNLLTKADAIEKRTYVGLYCVGVCV